MELVYSGSVLKKDTNSFVRSYRVFKQDRELRWELTQGQTGIFDAEDFDALITREWRAQRDSTFSSNEMFYVLCGNNAEVLSAHRFLAGLSHINPVTVDHRNKNGLDNRKSNLRLATTEQQMLNHTRTGKKICEEFSCGFRGVIQRKDNYRYRVRASVLGKQYNLGHFSCPIKAAECWDEFVYDGYKDHDPLKGLEFNGICGEPSLNFIHFNFPERLGL